MPTSIPRLAALTVAVTVTVTVTAAVAVAGTALAPASYAKALPSKALPSKALTSKNVVAPAHRAAHWQAGELSGGLIHNDQFGVDDYGLTVDTLFALRAAKAEVKQRKRVVRALRGNVRSYIGDGSGGTYAGSVAKMLVAALGAGPRAFGGVNLAARTRSLVDDSGPDRGRLKDDAGGDDFSNLIGQAYALQGLARVGVDVASVKHFLLQQQCGHGYFRLLYNDAGSNPRLRCTTAKPRNRTADLDATAIALSAMVSARRDGVTGLRKPIAKAAGWLHTKQLPSGAFRGSSPVVANTNSTGLAGDALAAAGRDAAAAKAAVWIASRQASPARVHDTKLAKEQGAVAFDGAVLRQGRKHGITGAARDQWRRSTAQAALGLVNLQSKRFRVRTARQRVRPGGHVRLRAAGLTPGEKYLVTVAGRRTAHGLASAGGTVRARIRIPKSVQAGRRSVVVYGAVGARSGAAMLRVRADRGERTSAASTARRGYPGKCKRIDRKGVTVVVDFRKLGDYRKHNGRTIVRCAPPHFTKSGKLKKRTGLKTLKQAGTPVVGTRLSGNAYVCRLDGRPARKERIRVDGDRDYREKCVRTPPSSAFWTYWHASGKGGGWKFNRTGAASRYATPGGYEGWSFALNARRGDYPKPRVRPR